MKEYFFTDLAYENHALYGDGQAKIREYAVGRKKEIRVWTLDIQNEDEAKRYRRAKGRYVTILCEAIWKLNQEGTDLLCRLLARETQILLQNLLPQKREAYRLLVVGLGNPFFTVDALGAETVKNVRVTGDVPSEDGTPYRVFAIAPGVPADTGLETVRHLEGILHAVNPDAVIAVDALKAGSYERLASSIQISDSGICPGSGVGRRNQALNKETLGIPVVAIGIPTVVDAATLIQDAMIGGGIREIPQRMREILEKEKGFLVCPKESDLIVRSGSLLLSSAIDLLAQGIS